MGDRRSGRRLLSEAQVDSAKTIATLAGSRSGQILLGQIAENLEMHAAAVESDLNGLTCLPNVSSGPSVRIDLGQIGQGSNCQKDL